MTSALCAAGVMMGFISAPLGISVALGCGHLSELDNHKTLARMASHPSLASIIEVAGIATAVCVALVTYLAYVLFSILATS